MTTEETRDGVALTNLDQPLFEGAGATKRDLVEYLDAVRDRILPELEDRPLSVIRVHRGQEAFMQKNVPRYTPDWVRRVRLWSESSHRDVDYALCNDRRTLIWFANQRAVEYHPTLVRAERLESPTHLVIDIDPPDADAFAMAARAAHLVRAALADAGLEGALKTSGSKGLHVYVPVDGTPSMAGRRRRHSRHRRAGGPPRPADRHDGVHEGGSGREGLHRRDPCRLGLGHLRVQPARAARHAGLVSPRLGRSRRRFAARLHDPHRRPAARRSRPVGRADARPAANRATR